jgi:PAS domain S-box-containing protein
MSKKKFSKRLEQIFDDVPKEEVKPPKQSKKPPVLTGALSPAKLPSPPRPRAVQPKLHVTRRLEEPPSLPPTIASGAISLALRTDEKNWATLRVEDESASRNWAMEEQMLVKQVADQLSLALENARLFQETQRRAEELAILNDLGRELTSQLDVKGIAESTFRHISRLMDTTNFFLGVYDPAEQILSFPILIDQGRSVQMNDRPLAHGLSDYVIKSKQPLYLPENVIAKVKELGLELLTIGNEAPALCWLGVPLLSGEKVVGIITVQSTASPNLYTPQHRDLLLGIASQVAIAIENARLFEVTRQSQQALARSEGELRALFAAMTDVIIVLDKEGRYVRIAPTNPSRLYRPAEDLLGRKMSEILPQETAQTIMAAIQQSLYSGDTVKLEYSLQINQKDYWFDGSLSKLNEGEVFLVARDITERKYNELIQAAITQISEAALTEPDMKGLIKAIHVSVSSLMPARNFYVALYDERAGLLTYPYYADERTTTRQPQKPGRDLTSYVLRAGKPLLVTPEVYAELERRGEIEAGGLPGTTWLGVPLRSGVQQLGVMAIQTYDPQIRLAGIDLDTLSLIAGQASIAIQRKHTQEDLAKFKLGIDHSDDAVFITDPDGTIVYANPGFEKVYGFKPEEAIGQNPRIFKSGLLTQDDYKKFWHTLLAKETVTGEFINRTKDGTLIPIAGTNSPILDEGGNIIGFLAVHHDMTETKRAEEALRKRNEYLAAAAEIGRLVTSTLDLNTIFSRTVNLVSERFGHYYAAIFTVEETGFNAILREATGPAGAEMKRKEHSLSINDKSIVGRVTLTGESVVSNNTALDPTHKPNPLLPETRAEAAIPLRVGNRIIGALDIQSTAVAAFTQDDMAVLQILADQVAIAIDNARSYELSQQAVKEMREADRVKSQFLANMSHELRTPLNSIIGFSRVILKGIDGQISELQQQDLTAIYNSGQHLLGLINDVLDLAKIEAGKMELAFDEVNISDLITSVMATASGLVKDKSIKLTRTVHGELPTVRADAMRVRQVLLNLLSNAAKFTDEGEIAVEAMVQSGMAGQPEILVSVTDTGPGIAPEDQAKLFQAFSQVDDSPTRKTGGSGLGLSISQQLIQLHGGRIGVHSALGKGSTFYFTLPVYHEKPELNKASGGRIILAIDDDPQVIALYGRYLEPEGYQVVALTDPARTKDRVQQLKPFAITLDIMMPGYDGWAVLRDLKSNPETRDIPVIICSIIEEQERGFSLGAADYLLKPILEEDLVNALDRLNTDGSIHEVLVVDDDPNDLRLIQKFFSGHHRYKAMLAQGGKQGWEMLTSHAVHAVILDLFMPDLDGFAILEKMRENAKMRDIPVIVISGGDLSPAQHQQLTEFGQRLMSKSSLNENDLLNTIEKALKRVESKK